MNKIYVLTIIMLIMLNCYSQNSLNFHSEMFHNLDTTRLTTNILADKAGIPELLKGFDGRIGCDTINCELWHHAYQTLYLGDIRIPSIPPVDSLLYAANATDTILINALCPGSCDIANRGY